MRLWSLHPKYLDRQGLLALWREGLLARKVLRGETRGYRNHPQLDRFRGPNAVDRIDEYLHHIVDEAMRRGYNFDRSKLGDFGGLAAYLRSRGDAQHWRFVSRGQVVFEAQHLARKLQQRGAPPMPDEWPELHPMFVTNFDQPEPEPWERGATK